MGLVMHRSANYQAEIVTLEDGRSVDAVLAVHALGLAETTEVSVGYLIRETTEVSL